MQHFRITKKRRRGSGGVNEPEPPPVHFLTSTSPPFSSGKFPRVPGHKTARLTRLSPQPSVHVAHRLHLAGLGSRLVEKPAAHASFVLSPGRLGRGHGTAADLVASSRRVFVAARVMQAEQIVQLPLGLASELQ